MICMCGAMAGYPHDPACPYPLFHPTPRQEGEWEKEYANRKAGLTPPDVEVVDPITTLNICFCGAGEGLSHDPACPFPLYSDWEPGYFLWWKVYLNRRAGLTLPTAKSTTVYAVVLYYEGGSEVLGTFDDHTDALICRSINESACGSDREWVSIVPRPHPVAPQNPVDDFFDVR